MPAVSAAVCNLLIKYGPLAGRILLALIFILTGFHKLTHWDEALAEITGQGIPLPGVLLSLTLLMGLGGGLMIACGWYARWAALVLFLLVIPLTLLFHPCRGDADQATDLLKNLAIMGGMLYIVAHGSGKYSLHDPACERRARARF